MRQAEKTDTQKRHTEQKAGPGFPPENTEAIFEPFFTTKDRGKGTGLGLAISKDIVEKYNGRVTARNHPEGGSVFTVHLPLEGENVRDKDYVPKVTYYEKA